jgi:hypothetical protein
MGRAVNDPLENESTVLPNVLRRDPMETPRINRLPMMIAVSIPAPEVIEQRGVRFLFCDLTCPFVRYDDMGDDECSIGFAVDGDGMLQPGPKCPAGLERI